MNNTQRENLFIKEDIQTRTIVGYIRVSTDQQDIGKQRETIVHHAKCLG
jgi:hypothetical protein